MAAWRGDARYVQLVEQHGMSLLHLAILLTGNRHDAEDVVQDALITVAAKWPMPQTVAYLRRAVSNRAIDLIRSRRTSPLEEAHELLADDRDFFRYEEDEHFFALVDMLPERQRQTLILRYYAELPYRDIARMLGVTIETVRSQASRGLAKLRESALIGGDTR